MTTTWAIENAALGRLLKDTGATQKYSDSLRKDGYNAALQIFAAHTAVATSTSLTGDGSTTQWSLPDNLIAQSDGIEAIWDNTDSEWLEPVRFVPGSKWVSPPPLGWYVWPEGTLNFTTAPASGDAYKIYYYAYWQDVGDDTSVISAPVWARQALRFYAAAYCLAPFSISAAQVGQFDTRTDSGNPEHNPVYQQARWWIKQFWDVLARHTPQQRGMVFTPGRAL